MLPRYFVTATDTGVGKTEVACALLSLMADAGLAPAAFKPYESGCEDLSSPADATALKAAARTDDDLALICPHRFRLPLAPGVAARPPPFPPPPPPGRPPPPPPPRPTVRRHPGALPRLRSPGAGRRGRRR